MPSPFKKIAWLLLVILFLLPFPSLAQDRQTTSGNSQATQGQTPPEKGEPSNSYGTDGVRVTTYDENGNAITVREYDSKHTLREVTYFSYHPGTKKIDHKERHYVDKNGATETRVDEHWAPDGSQIDSEIKHYGPHGSTTGGKKRDFVNDRRYVWDPRAQDWAETVSGSGITTTQKLEEWRAGGSPEEKKKRDEYLIRLQKEADEAAKERQEYYDNLKKEHDEWKKNHPDSTSPTSLAPTNLGILSPVNVNADDNASASIMPAKVAMAYSSVPGLTVTTFTVPMSTEPGLVDDGWFPGLVICTPDTGNCAPADEGHFTIHIPPGKATLDLAVRQASYPDWETRLTIPITKPTYSGSPYLLEVGMTSGYKNWLKEELDWAWDDILEIKDDLAYTRVHGPPADYSGTTDDYIGSLLDDLDDAYDDADDIADELSAKTVHDLAQFKARRAQFLLDNHDYQTSDEHDSLQREVNYFNGLANDLSQNYIGWSSDEYLTPPFAQVGRLDVIRGPFTGDCSRTRISLDDWPVTFIGQDARETYFMLPSWVLPGAHTLDLWQWPLEYKWPIFVIELTMSIDTPNLHLQTYPQSTMWHLTLNTGTTGSDPTLASDLSSGGYSPDLTSLGSIPNLPQGFQPPGQTSPGQIVVTATDLSPDVISIPQMPGGTETWVLGAQQIVPSGEFHVDYNASALSHGDYAITGRAVVMAKPIEATPVSTPGQESLLQIDEPNASSVSDKTPQQLADDAMLKYGLAHYNTENKLNALWQAWSNVIRSAPADIKTELDTAASNFDKADDAWKKAKDAYDKDPSDANNKAIYQTSETRSEAKIAYEKAHEKVLDNVDPKLRAAWRAANGDYQDALLREGMAKEAWQDAQKDASEKAMK